MNHAIKEQITDNPLYVEVEPQPKEEGKLLWKPCSYTSMSRRGVVGNDVYVFTPKEEGQEKEYTSPISIGDTVYQGEEWGFQNWWMREPSSKLWEDIPHSKRKWHGYNKQPPQTMPIELANKTFKVVGIEVEDWQYVKPNDSKYNPDEPKTKKWFWKYSLEEIE